MVHLIDWANPMENDFQIAEEVTVQGKSDRRPDLVVYVNGIAVAVIELKRGKEYVERAFVRISAIRNMIIFRNFYDYAAHLCGKYDAGITLRSNQNTRKVLASLERAVRRTMRTLAVYSGTLPE